MIMIMFDEMVCRKVGTSTEPKKKNKKGGNIITSTEKKKKKGGGRGGKKERKRIQGRYILQIHKEKKQQ